MLGYDQHLVCLCKALSEPDAWSIAQQDLVHPNGARVSVLPPCAGGTSFVYLNMPFQRPVIDPSVEGGIRYFDQSVGLLDLPLARSVVVEDPDTGLIEPLRAWKRVLWSNFHPKGQELRANLVHATLQWVLRQGTLQFPTKKFWLLIGQDGCMAKWSSGDAIELPDPLARIWSILGGPLETDLYHKNTTDHQGPPMLRQGIQHIVLPTSAHAWLRPSKDHGLVEDWPAFFA